MTPVSEIPVEAIRAILAYNWADEAADYEEQLAAGEIVPDDPSHIFTALNTVWDWIAEVDAR